MHKKAFTTTIALIIMIILVSAGVFLIVTKTHNNVTPVGQDVVNSDTQNVSETSNEVQISSETSNETSIAEDAIDTSNWQIYKNEEYGFEFKFPTDWFCGGISQDPNGKKSIFCSFDNNKERYYQEGEQMGGVMINVVSINSNINSNDSYGVITKTINRSNDNLEIIYFPFSEKDVDLNMKIVFYNIIGTLAW